MTNWLSRNLARLTLVGPILLVIIVGILFTSSMQDAAVLADTEKRGQLLKLSNALLHEVQKERGMTAGFIGSEGSAFGQEIKSQRRAVDSARAKLSDFATDYDDELVNDALINPMNAQLSRLTQVRSRVDSLDIPLGEALGYYTGINRFILDFNGVMASQTSVPLFKQKFTVLYNFSFSKEGAGIERALLSNAFGAGSFSSAVFNRWVVNKTQQTIYLQSAIAFATDEFKPYLIAFEKSEANQRV